MSIIILNINGISNPIKYKDCLLEWIKTTTIATISKKTSPNSRLSTEMNFKSKNTNIPE